MLRIASLLNTNWLRPAGVAMLIVFLLFSAVCGYENGNDNSNTSAKELSAVNIFYDADFCRADISVIDTVALRLHEHGMTVSVHALSGGNYAEKVSEALELGMEGLVVALPYDTGLDNVVSSAGLKGVKVMELFSQQFESTVSVSLDAYNAGYLLGRRLGEAFVSSNIGAPHIAVIGRDDKLLEAGFNDGLCELLPETVIRLKLNGDQPQILNSLSEAGPLDAVAVLYYDELLDRLPAQMYRIVCASFDAELTDHMGCMLVSQPGASISGAVEQFVNSLTGKRVDQQAFYFENTAAQRGLPR